MNVVAKLASEVVQTDGWLLVFVFVPVTLVVMVLVADALHERYNQFKSRFAVLDTGRH